MPKFIIMTILIVTIGFIPVPASSYEEKPSPENEMWVVRLKKFSKYQDEKLQEYHQKAVECMNLSAKKANILLENKLTELIATQAKIDKSKLSLEEEEALNAKIKTENGIMIKAILFQKVNLNDLIENFNQTGLLKNLQAGNNSDLRPAAILIDDYATYDYKRILHWQFFVQTMLDLNEIGNKTRNKELYKSSGDALKIAYDIGRPVVNEIMKGASAYSLLEKGTKVEIVGSGFKNETALFTHREKGEIRYVIRDKQLSIVWENGTENYIPPVVIVRDLFGTKNFISENLSPSEVIMNEMIEKSLKSKTKNLITILDDYVLPKNAYEGKIKENNISSIISRSVCNAEGRLLLSIQPPEGVKGLFNFKGVHELKKEIFHAEIQGFEKDLQNLRSTVLPLFFDNLYNPKINDRPITRKTLPEFDGIYNVTKFTKNGISVPETETKKLKAVFTDGITPSFIIQNGTNETKYQFKIDPTNNLIDITNEMEAEIPSLGLFETKNNQIKINFSSPGKPRPSQLQNLPIPDLTIIEFHRMARPLVGFKVISPLKDPALGEVIKIATHFSDPENGVCHMEYRFGGDPTWKVLKPDPDNNSTAKIEIDNFSLGDQFFEVRSFSEKGGYSEIGSQRFNPKLPENWFGNSSIHDGSVLMDFETKMTLDWQGYKQIFGWTAGNYTGVFSSKSKLDGFVWDAQATLLVTESLKTNASGNNFRLDLKPMPGIKGYPYIFEGVLDKTGKLIAKSIEGGGTNFVNYKNGDRFEMSGMKVNTGPDGKLISMKPKPKQNASSVIVANSMWVGRESGGGYVMKMEIIKVEDNKFSGKLHWLRGDKLTMTVSMTGKITDDNKVMFSWDKNDIEFGEGCSPAILTGTISFDDVTKMMGRWTFTRQKGSGSFYLELR